MNVQTKQAIRVVHLDADGFGDVSIERSIFESAFDGLTFETMAIDDASACGEADIVLTHYTELDELAMRAIRPEVIVRYATGVDGVDVEAATRLGIRVIRIPEYCDAEVAEHALALALALWRRLPQYSRHTAAGGWVWRHAAPGRRLADATFGLLGFGRKAREVAVRAHTLGCRVIAHDPGLADADIAALDVEAVSFEALMTRSDILSLHAPLTPSTDGLLDAVALARMPRGGILVNTARGRLIDEAALRAALDEGRLAGAGLDVLATEPPLPDHPLLGRDDVIVTPHAAWYSQQAEQRCRELGSQFAVAALRRQTCEGLVNPASLDQSPSM
jgi:D-3-phosphoglycerate dehydrogenase